MFQVLNPSPLPIRSSCVCAEAALGEVGCQAKCLGHLRLGDNCFVITVHEDTPEGPRPITHLRRGLAVVHDVVRLALQPANPPTWAVAEITKLGGPINPELPPENTLPREMGPALTWVFANLGQDHDLGLCAGLVLDPRVRTVEVEYVGGSRFATTAANGGYFGAVHLPGQPLAAAVRAWDVGGELLQLTRFL